MRLLKKLELHHIVLLGMFFLNAGRVTLDADTWWHLSAGRWMVEHRQLLSTDVFSFTRAGQPWQVPGWPVQIGMYLIYDRFGPAGLNIVTALLMTIALWLLYRSLSGSELLKASALILAGSVTVIHALARPALLTILFTAFFLNSLEAYRQDKRPHRLWLLPVAMIGWANSHGLFWLGMGLVGIYLIGSIRIENNKPVFDRRLAGLLPLLVGAACLNPYGPAMLGYIIRASSSQRQAVEFITEWQSPNFHLGQTLPFLLLLLLTLLTLGISVKRISRTDGLLLLTFTSLALMSGRNIALFGLAAPLILTRHAAELSWFIPSPRRPVSVRAQILAAMCIGLLCLFGLYRVAVMLPAEASFSALEKEALIPSRQAIAWIRENQPAGRMLNSYNWGGCLQWALPEYPVFVDGRTDLYGDEIVMQWYSVTVLTEGWQDVLDNWDIHWLILEKDWPVAQAFPLAGWQVRYQDAAAVILEKP